MYLYEELAASQHVQFQFGGRVEYAKFSPELDEPDRDFTNFSGSVGMLLLPSDQTTIAVSVARASRNPALEELYFHGPHAGNNAFENGDPNLDSEHGLDYVRGELTNTDVPLPRMPPLRGRAGVRFQRNAFQAGIDGVFTAKQDRINFIDMPEGRVGETPTDGYNLMKLFASYSFVTGKATSTVTARLDNATNELYFNHLNYLKDLAPEMGRDFRVVYSVKF